MSLISRRGSSVNDYEWTSLQQFKHCATDIADDSSERRATRRYRIAVVCTNRMSCVGVQFFLPPPDPPAIFCSTLACLSESAGMKPSHLVVMSVRLNVACSGTNLLLQWSAPQDYRVRSRQKLPSERLDVNNFIPRYQAEVHPSL